MSVKNTPPAASPLSNPQLSIGPVAYQTNEKWREVLHLGIRREYPRHAFVMMPGQSIEHLYLLTRGEVHISNFSAAESLTPVMFARSNSILGVIPFFTNHISESFWQVESDCVIYLFSHDVVHKEVSRELLINLLEHMASIGRHLTTRTCAHLDRNKVKQLARLLLHLFYTCPRLEAKPSPHGASFCPGITQSALSTLLGMHRVQLSRLIAALRQKGIIGKFTKTVLEICDLPGLQALADGLDDCVSDRD